MNIPKIGSKWTGTSSDKIFRVLHVIKMDDGHTWIHYCNNVDGDREYSCYLESFLERFRETL